MTDEPNQERLDELQAEIDEIQRRAEADGTIDDPRPGTSGRSSTPTPTGERDGDEGDAPS